MKTENVEEMTDLRLAEAMNQTWSQLMVFQNQLTVIQAEIAKRKPELPKTIATE